MFKFPKSLFGGRVPEPEAPIQAQEATMDDFEAVIEALQGLYVDHLTDVLAQLDSPDGRPEAQLFDQDDRPVWSAKLGLPQRADHLSGQGMSHIASAQALGYGMLMGDFGDKAMRVMMEEFTWDNCSLQLPYEIDGQDDLLRDWFNMYFGTAPAGDTGTMGVVHFMSDPEVEPETGITHIDIDFGSAPASAFWDLIQRLHDHGYDVVRFTRMPEVA